MTIGYFKSYDNDGSEIIKPSIIIDENDTHYITKYYISELGYWDIDNVQFSIVRHAWVGIHKSRLVRWETDLIPIYPQYTNQLTLF